MITLLVYGIRPRDGGFKLDPKNVEDARRYIGRPDIKSKIDTSFKNAISINDSPHMIIYGGSFAGKTHTLAYIEYLVTEKYNYNKDDIIKLDVSAAVKNDFVVFHGNIIDKIGQKLFLDTMRKFLKELEAPSDGSESKIIDGMKQDEVKEIFEAEDIGLDANLASALLWYEAHKWKDPTTLAKLWKWLCGRETTTKERDNLEVNRDTKKDPGMALNILVGFFIMYNRAHRGTKKLILLLDEMENLKATKERIFADCMRRLTRQDNLTLILSFSADRLRDLQNIINAMVWNHMPPDSIIRLEELDESGQQHEVSNFIKELIEVHRPADADLQKCVEENKHFADEVSETLTEDFLPFTNELIATVPTYIDTRRDPKQSRYPGTMMKTLNEFVAIGKNLDPNMVIYTKAKILPDL